MSTGYQMRCETCEEDGPKLWCNAGGISLLQSDDPDLGYEEAQHLLGFPSEDIFMMEWPDRYHDIAMAEGDAKGMLAVCDGLLDGLLVFDASGALVEADDFGADA